MTTEHIEYGATPSKEDCAQVGRADYAERRSRECRAWIGQLRRAFGPEPAGARLRVRAFPHDFGTYHEVCCDYDPAVEDAVAYAFKIEGELPGWWDAAAREELGI